jgi:Sigma-70, region 4/Bacterial RNA polymerase, alpha chain C terminal domain
MPGAQYNAAAVIDSRKKVPALGTAPRPRHGSPNPLPLTEWLGGRSSGLLQLPLSVLNLTVRAAHCLADIATLGGLLEYQETHLIRRRNFGRTSLVDVRRKLVHYFIDHEDPGGAAAVDPRRVREALYDPHPAFAAIWGTPAQARCLGEVVADLLSLLSRPDELRRAEPWNYSSTSIGPPRTVDFSSASLHEVLEVVFGCLKERERLVLDRRYGLLEGEPATLAEIGREFGLTRERVRQIVQSCLTKLAADGEHRRRIPLLECIRRGLEEAGGIACERELARAVQGQFPPPHPDLGPALRVLLEIETDYQPAGPRVWALRELPVEQIAAIQDAFHARLRAALRPLAEAAVLEAVAGGRSDRRDVSAVFLRGCLLTDPRIARTEEGLYGLVEWQWLLPRSLDDYIYLALRAAGRPRHYTWITDQVNALMPDGESVSSRDVHTTLLEHADRFVRSREGTYALVEWQGPRERNGAESGADGDGAAGRVTLPAATRSRPVASTASVR